MEAPVTFLCFFAINLWFISVLREKDEMHEALKLLGLIQMHTNIPHSSYTGKCCHPSLKQ